MGRQMANGDVGPDTGPWASLIVDGQPAAAIQVSRAADDGKRREALRSARGSISLTNTGSNTKTLVSTTLVQRAVATIPNAKVSTAESIAANNAFSKAQTSYGAKSGLRNPQEL